MKKIILLLNVILIAIGGAYFYKQYKFEHRFDKLLLCENKNYLDDTYFTKRLLNVEKTKEFYENYCKNEKSLGWFNSDLFMKSIGYELVEAIEESYNHGFDKEKYNLKQIKEDIKKYTNTKEFPSYEEEAKEAIKLDMLLTDAYIALFNDSYYGLTDWKKYKKFQHQYNKEYTLEAQEKRKQKLLDLNLSIEELTDEPLPKFEWEKPAKPLRDPANELVETLKNGEVYQSLNALHPDIKEYKKLVSFLKELRKNPNDNRLKINKILINLERFRWIVGDYDKSEKSIVVNIPSFTLHVLESGEKTWSMRVIVGKPKRPTPILEGELTHATLNPYWTAPPTIIREDMMKKADKMSEYLASHNMKLFKVVNDKKIEVKADDINWTIYKDAKKIPFVFRSEPGVDNPLGVIKFTFPNKYSVYMHDTDKRQYFAESYRAFSSGCVRLHEPKKLFSYLIGASEDINLSDYNSKNKPEYGVNLKSKFPVVFRYMTAGVSKDGRLEFYDDIYGYDGNHIKAIKGYEKIFDTNHISSPIKIPEKYL